jgi:hypothetical protein
MRTSTFFTKDGKNSFQNSRIAHLVINSLLLLPHNLFFLIKLVMLTVAISHLGRAKTRPSVGKTYSTFHLAPF